MPNIRYKIVLVDDNLATLNQGKSLLQNSYQVYTFQSATTLFENIEHIMPDLILLDVEMPEMDGFDVIKKLKEDARYKEIPVLFLTSRNDSESEKHGFMLGAADYISKPFSGPLLLKRISTQILYKQVQHAIDVHTNNMVKLHEELTEANERLKVLHEAKDTVMRVVSHDLKNYIGTISQAIELARQQELSAKLEKYISSMDGYTRKAISLIKDIVEMTEIETTDYVLNLKPVAIEDYLISIVDVFSTACELKNISFTPVFTASNPVVYIDPDKLWQVLNNLIHNAIKFTPREGNITMKTTIESAPIIPDTEKNGDEHEHSSGRLFSKYLVIHIIDAGMGIPAEFLPDLFEKFSKARRKGTEGEESTGIGLSIVKRIVKLHNGLITVSSVVDKGTEFCIKLPIYDQ